MRILLIFQFIIFTNLSYAKEEFMNKLETLIEFENFYDLIQPAQEKGEEAFVWYSGIPHPL